MFQFKLLSEEQVPSALEKAQRYRFLHEPMEAESICLDVLEVAPGNQDAIITLILSLTDQFDGELGKVFTRARELLPRLEEKYDRVYYDGIVCERRGKSHLKRGGPGTGPLVYEWIHKAMQFYEEAMEMDSGRGGEAVMRWNACARLLMRNPSLNPAEKTQESMLE